MKHKYIFLFLITSVIACTQQPTSKTNHIESELKMLTTDKLKKEYLEQIFVDDQKVRGSEGQELMIKYGKNSIEHNDYINRQIRQDSINLEKTEKYLMMHGYPNKSFGDRATTTPWVVIHHSQRLDSRRRNFKIIYEAYLDDKIDDNDISFYLGRMYQMKFGERLRMRRPYKSQDEIDKLISELDLLQIKQEVINNKGKSE